MKLTFLGAVRTVTGSNFLLETEGKKILVDCGMWQGTWFASQENHEAFYFDPSEIDYVLITHAHVDHIGRLPKLYKEGFRGKILCIEPTVDLARIILLDSVKVMWYEQNEFGYEPLFDENDVKQVLQLFKKIKYNQTIELYPNVKAIFYDAGHILGSAFIEIKAEGKKLVFSGDLGNPPVPFLNPTAPLPEVDYLIIESTYGNRVHEDKKRRKLILERTIEDTVTSKGVLMIPSFALERTQEILYELNELVEHNRIPKVPIFLDSPLAIHATEVYKSYSNYFNKEAKELVFTGDDIFQFPTLTITETKQESKKINEIKAPKVIIAGSGSGTGGRILYHEERYLSDPNSTVLIIAWQIPGSLGRDLIEHKKIVYIHNREIKVKAQIKAIGGYSAHADNPALLRFIKPSIGKLKKIFLVHGEDEAQKYLADEIKEKFQIPTERPKFKQSFEL